MVFDEFVNGGPSRRKFEPFIRRVGTMGVNTAKLEFETVWHSQINHSERMI
jgi:hypothetical protein